VIGPVFGIVVGFIALAGVIGSLAVLTSVYRAASVMIRLCVIGIAVALFWKACIAFAMPRSIDEADALIALGIAVVYWRRLVLDGADGMFDFLMKGPP
jgi:hypothetical protein